MSTIGGKMEKTTFKEQFSILFDEVDREIREIIAQWSAKEDDINESDIKTVLELVKKVHDNFKVYSKAFSSLEQEIDYLNKSIIQLSKEINDLDKIVGSHQSGLG